MMAFDSLRQSRITGRSPFHHRLVNLVVKACLFVGCLASQQHASVSQGRSAQTILRAATLR